VSRNPVAGLSLSTEGFQCKGAADGTLVMSGTLQMRAPSETLSPFFKQIHEAALMARLGELKVDVTRLVHVNSSSIFLFIDWARWIAAADGRYTLHFVIRPGVSWQHLTLPTMQRICVGSIRVSTVA